jgi:hypothetical protein
VHGTFLKWRMSLALRDIIINLSGDDKLISAIGDNQQRCGFLVPIGMFLDSLEVGVRIFKSL